MLKLSQTNIEVIFNFGRQHTSFRLSVYQHGAVVLPQYPNLALVVLLGPSYLRSVHAGRQEMQTLVLKDKKMAANNNHTNTAKISNNNASANTTIVAVAEKALLILCTAEIHQIFQDNPDGWEDQ